MKPMHSVMATLGVSLFFAGAIVLSANLIEDSETSQNVQMILIALWIIPFSYLSIRRRQVMREQMRNK